MLQRKMMTADPEEGEVTRGLCALLKTGPCRCAHHARWENWLWTGEVALNIKLATLVITFQWEISFVKLPVFRDDWVFALRVGEIDRCAETCEFLFKKKEKKILGYFSADRCLCLALFLWKNVKSTSTNGWNVIKSLNDGAKEYYFPMLLRAKLDVI